jgi:hypothetical protein
MADRKDRMALLSRYSKLHKIKYQEKPLLNLNVEQWASDALIESFGLDICYDMLQYYFDVSPNPNWKYFANYADTIITSRERLVQDLRERSERRKKAKEWLSE